MTDNLYAPPQSKLQIESNDKLNPLFLTLTVLLAVFSLVQFRIELNYVMEYSNNTLLSWLSSTILLAAKLSMVSLVYFAYRRPQSLLFPIILTWLLFLFNTSLYYFRFPVVFNDFGTANFLSHIIPQIYLIASMVYVIRRRFKRHHS